ncbi:MAG: hypothetical protein MJZ81_07225 [Bacteroidales bacterium]|nr:hypothetical protein [Bacteroidales bacterium]
MRSFLLGAKVNVWTNPYVTNGLIAMWDGEWNAGGGVHDATSTTIVDVSGNGRDATLASGWSVGDKSFIVSSRYSVGIARKEGEFDELVSAGGYTIECVFKPNGTGNYCYIGNECGLTVWSSTLFRHHASNLYNGAGVTAGIAFNTRQDIIGNNWHFAMSVSLGGPTKTFINGTLGSNRQDVGGLVGDQYPQFVGLTMNGAWRNTNAGLVDGGEFYCVRYYKGALTDTQISANYAIDARRFGL